MSANQRVFPAETRLTVYRRRNIHPPSVFPQDSIISKFGPEQVSNLKISAPRVDIRISLGPPEDIGLKNRFLPKMILNIEFMIILPQRESMPFDLISLKNIIFPQSLN